MWVTKEVIQAFNEESIWFTGYAFQIEMKFKAWIKGFRLTEIPIVFTDRARGTSKMNRSIISEAILHNFNENKKLVCQINKRS